MKCSLVTAKDAVPQGLQGDVENRVPDPVGDDGERERHAAEHVAPMVGEVTAARGQVPVDGEPEPQRGEHDAAHGEDRTERGRGADHHATRRRGQAPRRRTPGPCGDAAAATEPARPARSAPTPPPWPRSPDATWRDQQRVVQTEGRRHPRSARGRRSGRAAARRPERRRPRRPGAADQRYAYAIRMSVRHTHESRDGLA